MADQDKLGKIREKLGLIHLYCGDGKGKTTAAIGLAVRARGSGLNVLFVQFLKAGNSAELDPLRRLGVEVLSGQPTAKFIFQMTEEEKEEARVFNRQRLEDVIVRSQAGIDLLILDETLGAIATDMIDEDRLLDFLTGKPLRLELVLTGRDPSDRLLEAADYVSEVMMRKHPYETQGLGARPGIEF